MRCFVPWTLLKVWFSKTKKLPNALKYFWTRPFMNELKEEGIISVKN